MATDSSSYEHGATASRPQWLAKTSSLGGASSPSTQPGASRGQLSLAFPAAMPPAPILMPMPMPTDTSAPGLTVPDWGGGPPVPRDARQSSPSPTLSPAPTPSPSPPGSAFGCGPSVFGFEPRGGPDEPPFRLRREMTPSNARSTQRASSKRAHDTDAPLHTRRNVSLSLMGRDSPVTLLSNSVENALHIRSPLSGGFEAAGTKFCFDELPPLPHPAPDQALTSPEHRVFSRARRRLRPLSSSVELTPERVSLSGSPSPTATAPMPQADVFQLGTAVVLDLCDATEDVPGGHDFSTELEMAAFEDLRPAIEMYRPPGLARSVSAPPVRRGAGERRPSPLRFHVARPAGLAEHAPTPVRPATSPLKNPPVSKRPRRLPPTATAAPAEAEAALPVRRAPVRPAAPRLMRSVSADFISAIERADAPVLPLTVGHHADLNSISADTAAALITDPAAIKGVDTVTIVDCRFPYEYKGGHIQGATSAYTTQDIDRLFLDEETCVLDRTKTNAIVFHCEFSSQRAPALCRHLRRQDRARNQYPKLFYPQIYILHKGYKEFFGRRSDLCCPSAYVTMDSDKAQSRLYMREIKPPSVTKTTSSFF